jgi:hypothetical protein
MSYNGPERRAHQPTRAFKQAIREFGHEPTGRWHHIFRDFVPLIAVLGLIYAVVGIESKVDRAEVKATTAEQVAASQRAGRRTAVSITCGATSAIIEAGRATILGGGRSITPELERNLRRLGYPSRAQREREARRAAEAYSLGIASAIEKESGVQGIVREDGTLDCDRLLVAARAQP